MANQRKNQMDVWARRAMCRIEAAIHCTDNIYEQIRVRVVRVMREYKSVPWAAEILGMSEKTVRRYLNFVPFEHLMHDPSLEKRFDWRSMTDEKWTRLLQRHPQFISRLPRNRDSLSAKNTCAILIKQPQLASRFDLDEWNRLELDITWAELLIHHPEFFKSCDFSMFSGYAAKILLCKKPFFFNRIRIETLEPYHWTECIERQPVIAEKMDALPRNKWPFNYWVHYIQFRPEAEAEFSGWNKIESADLEDLKRRQPEMYARHKAEFNPDEKKQMGNHIFYHNDEIFELSITESDEPVSCPDTIAPAVRYAIKNLTGSTEIMKRLQVEFSLKDEKLTTSDTFKHNVLERCKFLLLNGLFPRDKRSNQSLWNPERSPLTEIQQTIWARLEPMEKMSLLCQHPELFPLLRDPQELSADLWLLLLADQPQFEPHFDWSRIEKKFSYYWTDLLKKQPQFASHCDFSLLKPWQLRKLKNICNSK